MVGFVSERLPKTGVPGHRAHPPGWDSAPPAPWGVPAMGKIADRYLAESLDPAATVAVLESVESTFPAYLERARQADASSLGYRAQDVQDAYDATVSALSSYRGDGARWPATRPPTP